MAKDDIVGALVGIFLGLVGVAILAELFKPKCPNCQNPLQQGATYCPRCGWSRTGLPP